MPAGDGTGPNGTYKNCIPQEELVYGNKPFRRGFGRGRGRGAGRGFGRGQGFRGTSNYATIPKAGIGRGRGGLGRGPCAYIIEQESTITKDQELSILKKQVANLEKRIEDLSK